MQEIKNTNTEDKEFFFLNTCAYFMFPLAAGMLFAAKICW